MRGNWNGDLRIRGLPVWSLSDWVMLMRMCRFRKDLILLERNWTCYQSREDRIVVKKTTTDEIRLSWRREPDRLFQEIGKFFGFE